MSSVDICNLCNLTNAGENHIKELAHVLQLLTGLEIPKETSFVCSKCAKQVLYIHSFIEKLRNCFSACVRDVDHVVCDEISKIPTDTRPPFRTILPKITSTHHQESKSDVHETPRTQRMYNCLDCAETFHAYRQLVAHRSRHQQNSSLNVCEYCSCLYADADVLAKHIGAEHGDKKYTCLCCGKMYGSRGRLKQHLSAAHNQETLLYTCALCSEQTAHVTTYPELEQHFHAVHSDIATAMATKETPLYNNDQDMEMTEEFLDEFLLGNSDDNSFQLSEWEALDLHLPDVLSSNNVDCASHAYTCPKCYEACVDQPALLQHLAKRHAMKVLNCNKCEVNFNDVDEFRRHKTTHSNTAVHRQQCHQCGICDKTFRSNAALIYHVKTHSRTAMRPHICPYCSKRFHTDINLKQHLRIVHIRVKQKVCELCDAQFATLDHLKKHVLSQHQNERKHVCVACGQRFTQRCHLKQHAAIHGRKHRESATTVVQIS